MGSDANSVGHKYVGEFKDGKYNGQGTYTTGSGYLYVGEFKDGKYNGQATFTFHDGNKYVGEYKDDRRHGQGTFTFTNGNKYVGNFKDNQYNGQGTLFASDGSVISQGIWSDGNFVRSTPVQREIVPNQENNRVLSEVEEAKRKLAELEQQLRIAQQQVSSTLQDNNEIE